MIVARVPPNIPPMKNFLSPMDFWLELFSIVQPKCELIIPQDNACTKLGRIGTKFDWISKREMYSFTIIYRKQHGKPVLRISPRQEKENAAQETR
jgi:hypothetical protein